MNTKISINKAYRIFQYPIVYLTSGSGGIDAVVEHGERGAFCLINLIWIFGPGSLRVYLPKFLKLKKKGIRYCVIGSCRQDMMFLKIMGIPCVFANQNQFLLEENIPLKPPGIECDYDAFYAAQSKPFKRMHLASEIEKLYVLTYGWPKHLNASRNLADFEPKLSHASYNKSYLDFTEVSKLMHRSACALALSRKEGAMWAAYEALLSGLPLVSTKSKGGRDRYFDERTVKIVSDSPSAVKAAVEDFKRNPPDPEMIRRITLKKMEEDRERTVGWFQRGILKGAGIPDAQVYQALFRDGEARTPVSF